MYSLFSASFKVTHQKTMGVSAAEDVDVLF